MARRWRLSRNRAVRILLSISLVAVIAGVGSFAYGRYVIREPKLGVGNAPDGYGRTFVEPNGVVDIAKSGAVPLGGEVEGDVTDVFVTIGGETARAIMDRSVEPPTWSIMANPPSSGRYRAEVVAVGPDGYADVDYVRFEARLPAADDLVVAPESIVLESDGAPAVKRFDPKTGEIVLDGASPGDVLPNTVIVSPATKAFPGGLLRTVTAVQREGDIVTAETRQARLDEIFYQVNVEASPGFFASVGGFNIKSPVALGLPNGAKADNAVDLLDKSQAYSATIGNGKEAPEVRYGMAGDVAASGNLDIQYRSFGWFKIPSNVRRIDFSANFKGVLAASIAQSATFVDTAAAAKARISGEKKDIGGQGQLFESDFGYVSFLIGPIPVVLNAEIAASYNANAKLTATFKISALTEVELGGRVTWAGGQMKVVPVRKATFTPDVRILFTGEASLLVSLSFGLELYGSLDFAMSPGLEATAKLDADTGRLLGTDNPADFVANVKAALSAVADAEFRFNIFTFDFNAKKRLASYGLAQCEGSVAPLVRQFVVSCSAFGAEGGLSSGIGTDPGGSANGGSADKPTTGSLSMVLLLDVSSSMNEPDGSGGTRIEGARRAVRDFLGGVKRDARVGLRAYPENGDCGVGELLVPVQRVDEGSITSAVDALVPDGNTPTHVALQEAANDLPAVGYRTIVLVSDGESNCGGEGGVTCEVARNLAETGITTVNSVGFQISNEGAEELQCIADATKGNYETVETSEQLVEHLEELSGPKLEVTVDAPSSVDLASGGGSTTATVKATVNNVGSQDATEVVAKLDQTGIAGLAVPDAGRLLGTVHAGERAEIEWLVPVVGEMGTAATEWTVGAAGGNVESAEGADETEVLGVDAEQVAERLGPLLGDAETAIVVGDDMGYTRPGAGRGCDEPGAVVGQYGDGYLFSNTVVLACRGATTADLVATIGPRAQFNRFVKSVSGSETGAVLASVGASDVGLQELLAACVRGLPRCQSESTAERFEMDLRGVRLGVLGAATAYDDTTGGRVPMIYFAYPHLFPNSGGKLDRCFDSATAADLRAFDYFVERLNDTIASGVADAKKSGAAAYFVASSESAVVPDDAAAVSRSACDTNASLAVDPADGTTEWSNMGAASSASAGLLVDLDEWDAPVRDRTNRKITNTHKPTRQIEVSGSGFAPDSLVVVRSGPVASALGSALADGKGHVKSKVEVPGWIDDTSVLLAGSDSDGRERLMPVKPRDVGPVDHSGLWTAVAIVSLFGMLGAGLWFVVLWRRSSTASMSHPLTAPPHTP